MMNNQSTKCLFLTLVLLHFCAKCMSEGQLKVGFYSESCPNADLVVNSVVTQAAITNPRVPPILLRLHFHDCFVEGCDASILITQGVISPESTAHGHQGVTGFNEIAKAKEELESQCPGVVSCADIIAMAARDAVALAGGPSYEVETGRRDGRISSASLGANMPDFHESIDVLKSKFADKGLSEADLVLLSGGAHTIGTAACFFVTERLYTFMGTNGSDPTISPDLLPSLKLQCPKDGDSLVRVPLDQVTREKFDVQSLRNIRNGFSVLLSDARLYDDAVTKSVVDSYAVQDSTFGQDFASAMVKMGRIGVKGEDNGEIRRVCDTVNQGQPPRFTSDASRRKVGFVALYILMLLMVY